MFRSGTMRFSCLGQVCADIREATKCLAQRMLAPNEYDSAEWQGN